MVRFSRGRRQAVTHNGARTPGFLDYYGQKIDKSFPSTGRRTRGWTKRGDRRKRMVSLSEQKCPLRGPCSLKASDQPIAHLPPHSPASRSGEPPAGRAIASSEHNALADR